MKLSPYVPLIVIGAFAAFFAVERIFPLRVNRRALFARLIVNLAISGLAFLTALIVVRPSAMHALGWATQKTFGLVSNARMHGIHHSQVRHETNSNFGVVFCWWDKVHRTIWLNIPQAIIEIGVAGYSGPKDNGFWHTLTLPFRKQRDYWRKPDGRLPERDPATEQQNRAHLAE